MRKMTVKQLVDLGFKQKEIAQICEVSEPCVNKWGKGIIPSWHYKKIMKVVRNRANKFNKFLERMDK